MEITAAHTHRYTNGDCYNLAQAVADATGWQMVLWSGDDGETGHVQVRTPAGLYLDITGTATGEQMHAQGWTADDITEIDDAYNLGWGPVAITDETSAIAAHLIATVLA